MDTMLKKEYIEFRSIMGEIETGPVFVSDVGKNPDAQTIWLAGLTEEYKKTQNSTVLGLITKISRLQELTEDDFRLIDQIVYS